MDVLTYVVVDYSTGIGREPIVLRAFDGSTFQLLTFAHPRLRKSLRKEVIQPQVPLRLPCYDLVPVTTLAVGTQVIGRLKALAASMT